MQLCIHPGSVSQVPVISTDLYPTILAAAGLPLRPFQHLDGENLVPLLTGEGHLDREALFWHYPHYNQHPQSFPSAAVRAGDWKLIEAYESGEVALYQLDNDIGETQDLAEAEPAKRAELQAMLEAWRTQVAADPMRPNPEYTGK